MLDGSVAVAKFTLATSESFRDKSGQLHTITNWHTIVLWRGLAELAQAYMRRGSLVYVEGRLKTRHYDDAAGMRHYVTEIMGQQVLMLYKKPGADAPPLGL